MEQQTEVAISPELAALEGKFCEGEICTLEQISERTGIPLASVRSIRYRQLPDIKENVDFFTRYPEPGVLREYAILGKKIPRKGRSAHYFTRTVALRIAMLYRTQHLRVNKDVKTGIVDLASAVRTGSLEAGPIPSTAAGRWAEIEKLFVRFQQLLIAEREHGEAQQARLDDYERRIGNLERRSVKCLPVPAVSVEDVNSIAPGVAQKLFSLEDAAAIFNIPGLGPKVIFRVFRATHLIRRNGYPAEPLKQKGYMTSEQVTVKMGSQSKIHTKPLITAAGLKPIREIVAAAIENDPRIMKTVHQIEMEAFDGQ